MMILSSAAPFMTAFVAVVVTGPSTIEALRRLNMKQLIGSDAPQPVAHQAKTGTPTMGGVLFVVGVLAAVLVGLISGQVPISASISRLAAVLLVFLAHTALGFLDDYLKATRGKTMGLIARQKLAGQLVIATAFAVYLFVTAVPGLTTQIALFPGHVWNTPVWIYYPFVVLLMMGMSNCVNLTDGLDGLASGLAVLAFAGLSLTSYMGDPEVIYFGWAMAGACLGFLCYNGYPARVFMGDTGSLAIGASLAAMAVVGKQELPVLIFCLVFIVELLSVVIQVISFKSTGKRVFKSSPIHHHFELLGWKEVQIVQRFWITGVAVFWLGLIAAYYVAPFLSVSQP